MTSQVLVAIITSSVAIIAAIVSLFIGLRSLRMQKKISNSGKQLEYLQSKLKLLDEAKSEISLVDFHKSDIGLTNRDNLVKVLAEYTEGVLVNLPKIIQKLKGHFDNSKLNEFEIRINKVNKFKMNQTTQKIMGIGYSSDLQIDEAIVSDPVNYTLNTKDEFKKFIIDEMLVYNARIEKIIEISLR
jgi:hypothetical protein